MKGYSETVDGWLTLPEAELLDKYNTGFWLEIGCWKGKSTRVLAAKHQGIAIDWFEGNIESRDYAIDLLKEFKKNTKPYKKNIALYAMRFEEVSTKSFPMFDLIWLDAEHTYDSTKAAFEKFEPLLKSGGVVIFHDVYGGAYPEVKQFTDSIKWENIENADRSAAFRKPEANND